VSFDAIALCVVSQLVFIIIVIVYFVIDSVWKLLDKTSCGYSEARTGVQKLNCVLV
jgi:hypothetical protein